ncbi:anti-sigma factor [Arthrobacter sp. U41]|uniref:anti-sigma factor n=1 Tax=Arthrobacter sp. U41 TaxID=1849032 RepID=UPI0021B634EC|nr:anti-sigma factor [Arthrobacter sp. U41]
MRLLKRLLRRGHDRRRQHVESCTECRQQLRRERQYLERLRGAEVPMASGDLTARLLARTEELARSGEPAPYTLSAAVPEARGFRPAIRATVLAAGGTVAAAAMLGASAYLMGGEPAPLAGGTPASVFLQRDLSASAPAADDAAAGPPAGWSLTGEPDFTPDGALTAAQLATLRSEGWTCPELRELGYHLVWARGGVLAGINIVELRLTDGRHFATILEQHGSQPRPSQPSGAPGDASQASPPAPVNVLTGRSAASDGFTTEAVPAGGVLWVNHASPFAAIYQSGDTTFTYVSDQAAEQADDGVAALVRAGTLPPGAAGDAPGSGAGHSVTARLERGMGRILELLAP